MLASTPKNGSGGHRGAQWVTDGVSLASVRRPSGHGAARAVNARLRQASVALPPSVVWRRTPSGAQGREVATLLFRARSACQRALKTQTAHARGCRASLIL
jgi:hypothetical protein